jgi:hypothetical protein
MEYVRNRRVRFQAAKRTLPWDLKGDELKLASPRPLLEHENLQDEKHENLQDENLPPAAKRQRLQAPTTCTTFTASDAVVHAHTADTVTTGSPDDTPTDPVTATASVPSAAASRALPRKWKAEEDTTLIEAVQKIGKHWVAVAVMVPGRTNIQCRNRWVTVNPADGKNKGK